MMDMDNITAFLKDNPGSTAKEIGCLPIEINRLEAKNLVVRVGERKGGRGRPAVEWALPGQDLPKAHVSNVVGDNFLRAANRFETDVLPKLFDEDARIMRYIIKGLREPNREESDRRLLIETAKQRGYTKVGA